MDSNFQGRELQATVKAPTRAQLEFMLQELQNYSQEVEMDEINLMQPPTKDVDGGWQAVVSYHNDNLISWFKTRFKPMSKEERKNLTSTIHGLTEKEREEEEARAEKARRKKLETYVRKEGKATAGRKLTYEEEKAISDIELGKRKAKGAIKAEKARRAGYVPKTTRRVGSLIVGGVSTRIESGLSAAEARQAARRSPETIARMARESQLLEEERIAERARQKLARESVRARMKLAKEVQKKTAGMKERSLGRRIVETGGARTSPVYLGPVSGRAVQRPVRTPVTVYAGGAAKVPTLSQTQYRQLQSAVTRFKSLYPEDYNATWSEATAKTGNPRPSYLDFQEAVQNVAPEKWNHVLEQLKAQPILGAQQEQGAQNFLLGGGVL